MRYILIILILICSAAYGAEPLKFGISAAGAGQSSAYEDFRGYLKEKLGRDITPVYEQNYDRLNTMLKSGEVDFAAAYSTAMSPADRNRIRLIALPMVHGRISFRSYILVNSKSGIKNMDGLKGAVFGLTDRVSGSGALYPAYIITKYFRKQPKMVLKTIYYTGGSERSVFLLNRGVIQAAACDGAIFEKIHRKTPKETENITVIHKSPEIIAPPFAASARLDAVTQRRLKNLLINMDNDPEGKIVLRELKIQKYVSPCKKEYQTITGLINSVGALK